MFNFGSISGKKPLNQNAIGAAASVGAAGVDLLNIGSQNYGNLKFDGYQANGLAAGVSMGSALGPALAPLGMLVGGLAGTAYDIFNFKKRKADFQKEKAAMGIRDWRNTLNAGQSDATGQFYL